MERLFVVVRSDLTPGAQCAQACHALRAFVAAHEALDRAWYTGTNNLVVLQVPDERALEALVERARREEFAHSVFREPDFGDTITAVALEGRARRLVSSFPLALRAAA